MRNELGVECFFLIGYASRYWYDDAIDQIGKVCRAEKWDCSHFAGIIAATSPRCSVRRNIRLSLHYMRNKSLPVGTMRMIVNAVDKWETSRKISGPKVSAFYANLTGDYDCITWDTHMFQCFAGKSSFRKSELSRAESIIRSISKKYNLMLAQTQAAIWSGWRMSEGLNPSPFSVFEEWNNFNRRLAIWGGSPSNVVEDWHNYTQGGGS